MPTKEGTATVMEPKSTDKEQLEALPTVTFKCKKSRWTYWVESPKMERLPDGRQTYEGGLVVQANNGIITLNKKEHAREIKALRESGREGIDFYEILPDADSTDLAKNSKRMKALYGMDPSELASLLSPADFTALGIDETADKFDLIAGIIQLQKDFEVVQDRRLGA